MVAALAPILDTSRSALPRANVRDPHSAFDSEEFALIANVPVFAEHETTVRDGRRLKFGRQELQAIADRCNRRISETGDYAAVVLGHTPDPDQAAAPMPELVGYAGPFRLGVLGQPDNRERWAILADFHIFKSDWQRVRKYPRRSPELWLEDRFEDMFLDPIALLGAEAPRLDMGLLYAARFHGRLVERYTAVAPAAASVFMPAAEVRRYAAEPVTSSRSSAMPLTPDDVHQIVDALEQVDWVQFVKSLMSAQQGNNASVPPADAPPAGPPPGEPGMGAGLDAGMGAPPAGPAAPLTDSGAPPAGPAVPPAGPAVPPPGPAVPPPGPDAGLGSEPPAPPPDLAAASEPPMGAEDGGSDDAGAAPDEDEDEDEDDERKRYAAGSIDGHDGPTAASVDGNIGPSGPGSVDGSVARFSRLKAELDSLRGQLSQERSRRVDAERYSRLADLRYRIAFDVDEEHANCSAQRMSDEQFELHVRTLEKYAKRIPVFADLPVDSGAKGTAPATAPAPGANRELYRKQARDKAFQWCVARRLRGEEADYEAALKKCLAGETLPD